MGVYSPYRNSVINQTLHSNRVAFGKYNTTKDSREWPEMPNQQTMSMRQSTRNDLAFPADAADDDDLKEGTTRRLNRTSVFSMTRLKPTF